MTRSMNTTDNPLADDAFRQLTMAGDDLIAAMGRFQAAFADEKSKLVGQVRGDVVIGDVDAEVQAMQIRRVKNAVADCEWAATRVNAFGTLYQCAVLRQDQVSEFLSR